MRLDELIAHSRVVLVCGAGGVGKTTAAAAIAARAAFLGRRVVVLTIDPARRLAQALSLRMLGGAVSRVQLPLEAEGELYAAMLDVRSTYDALLERYIADPARREAIRGNHFYRHFTAAIGGSHEYGAIEKLYELSMADDYDLLVLDTPPSTQALDFLGAPERLAEALDSSLFSWFGGGASRFGSGYIIKTLGRFAGRQVLEELRQFLSLFKEMLGGLGGRAGAVKALLAREDTAFVLVSAPSHAALSDSAQFAGELQRLGFKPAALLINRYCPPLSHELDAGELAGALPPGHGLDGAAISRLLSAQRDYQSQALDAERDIRRIFGLWNGIELLCAPLAADDPTNIEALLRLAMRIRECS